MNDWRESFKSIAQHQKVIAKRKQHEDVGFERKPRQERRKAVLHVVGVEGEEFLELIDDQYGVGRGSRPPLHELHSDIGLLHPG